MTICTKNRGHCLGKIVNNDMNLNSVGEIADRCWRELPAHFPNIELDESVVMPNHVHGFGDIVGSFQSAVSKRVITMNNTPGACLWQSGYYDHIIRDERSLIRIRDYITTNPQRWTFDKEIVRRKESEQFGQWLTVEGQKVIKSTRRML